MKRKKYFICSDIHGFHDEWMKALKKAGFDIENPLHKIIHCGDLLDRGKQAVECLKFVSEMLDKGRIICIKGNHEVLFEDIYRKRYYEKHDYHNGTVETYSQLAKDLKEPKNLYEEIYAGYNHPLVQKYLAHCINYYETDKHIFVHAYIPVIKHDTWEDPERMLKNKTFEEWYEYVPLWRDYPDQQWEMAMWKNPFQIWDEGIREPDKTIVCGHWGTYQPNHDFHGKGHISRQEFMDYGKLDYCFEPFIDKQIIGLDATTAYSKQVNVVVLQNGMKPVPKMKEILKEHYY